MTLADVLRIYATCSGSFSCFDPPRSPVSLQDSGGMGVNVRIRNGCFSFCYATRTSRGSCSGRFRRLQKCSYGPSGHLSLMRLHQIACSIVGSRLDYCNSLLPNCSNRNLDKLQRMQNNMACVVCNSSRLTPAEPLLQSLHWLPVRQRINYKLANLCYLAVSRHQLSTLLI